MDRHTASAMESSGLKRKDTTKGPPLRILSLDGGGVRGYSIFIILQEIMHRTFVEIEGRAPHRNEIPKPADHFDLIVGTGTGGLIALMLGRLRLDIETCKELYVRLTRMVFETDKTILGIPTHSTLFKASKLEEAIREAVYDHTTSESEGKDSGGGLTSPLSAGSRLSGASVPARHASNASVVSFSARSPAAQMAPRPYYLSKRGGNPNALLYDSREFRTKTVVTAIYRGAPRGEEPVLLRSYDSRKEPAPEFDCRIWEAGRATCAIGLAFKPIQIGQSVFHDNGQGTFNPSPYALDEAAVNEWPGREVGVFLSVGTGKRPGNSDSNSQQWYDGFLGDFADARRKLISKIEGCEKIHEYMKREHLMKRGVNVENYYRLNVEVGVGEFGMNEWHRLADISTGTKRYLSRPAERSMVQTSAAKLAKIHRANIRYNRLADVPELLKTEPEVTQPLAVELPGDMPTFSGSHYSPRQSYESGADRLSLPANNGTPSPRNSGERLHPPRSPASPPPAPPRQHAHSTSDTSPHRQPPLPPIPSSSSTSVGGQQKSHNQGTAEDDRLVVNAPTPEQYRNASNTSVATEPRRQQTQPAPLSHQGPPPLPPKTPLQDGNGRPAHRANTYTAPYPIEDDDAPPPVNKARKPEYRSR